MVRYNWRITPLDANISGKNVASSGMAAALRKMSASTTFCRSTVIKVLAGWQRLAKRPFLTKRTAIPIRAQLVC
jgi:hypothetical protein